MRNVFAGVDVGGTRIKVGLADDSGRVLSCHLLETHDSHNAEDFLKRVAGEISHQASAATVPIKAIGIGCPGRIDFESGTIVWLKTKVEFLEGIPLASRLTNLVGCPVVCDNDVNAILAGEMRFGAGRGHQDVVAITVGTGIGGALVVGGQMVRGRNCATGHFGYMSHDPCGPRHVCGNTGIVEEYASQSGISRQLRAALATGDVSPLTKSLACGDEPGLRELFEAVDKGDSLARRLADRLVREMGVLVADLIYALDPELILIGGGLICHRPEVLDAIRQEVAARVSYLPTGATQIQAMALGDAAGVLGGVALAMDKIEKRGRACVPTT